MAGDVFSYTGFLAVPINRWGLYATGGKQRAMIQHS